MKKERSINKLHSIKKLRLTAGVFLYHKLKLVALVFFITISAAVFFVFAVAVMFHCVVVPVVTPVAVFPWRRIIGCVFVAGTIVDAMV